MGSPTSRQETQRRPPRSSAASSNAKGSATALQLLGPCKGKHAQVEALAAALAASAVGEAVLVAQLSAVAGAAERMQEARAAREREYCVQREAAWLAALEEDSRRMRCGMHDQHRAPLLCLPAFNAVSHASALRLMLCVGCAGAWRTTMRQQRRRMHGAGRRHKLRACLRRLHAAQNWSGQWLSRWRAWQRVRPSTADQRMERCRQGNCDASGLQLSLLARSHQHKSRWAAGPSTTPHLDIAVDELLKQACCMQQAPPAFSASVTVTAADHDAAWEYISAGQPAAPLDTHEACGDNAPAADCTTRSAAAHDVSSSPGKLLWARTLAALFHAANAVLLPAEQPSHSLKLPLRLAVIGPPGSGRSSLATALASRFNLKARAMTHQLIALLHMRTVHI